MLNLIKRLKTLADTGLVYADNEYEKERYEEIREIGLKLLSQITDKPFEALNDFYLPETDYPTPKVDIRALVLNEKKEILLVREKLDGKWALPGGWADMGFTPSEIAKKEVMEETGLDVNVLRLLAVFDKRCHNHPPQPFYVYKMVFLCEVIGGEIKTAFDIEDVDYFSINNLPELSEDRILKSQIEQVFQIAEEWKEVYFD